MDRSGEGHKRTQPTQSDNRAGGGRGRKECTDSLPHPSPASNLSSGILQPSLTGAEAEGTGRGLPTAAGTPPHPPLPISFCGKPRGVVHDPGSLLSAPACDRRASCVPMGGAQRGERAAVNSGRRHGSRRGWVRGRAESSLSRCWRAAAESQLGPGCTGRPRPPSGSLPRPISYQDPPRHPRQVSLDCSQKSRKKTTSRPGSEEEGKVYKHSSGPLFYLTKDGATQAPRGRGSAQGGAENQGHTPGPLFNLGRCPACWIQFTFSNTWRLSFPVWQLENIKEFINNCNRSCWKKSSKSPYTTKGLGGTDVRS